MSLDLLLRLTAAALELPVERVRAAMDRAAFTGLGGSSLQAVRLSAAARQAGLAVPLSQLLSQEKLGAVLRGAGQAAALEPLADAACGIFRPLLPGQQGVLHTDDFFGGSAYHLIFTARVTGASADAVPAAIRALVGRHEGLRTVFSRPDPATGRYGRRVLPSWEPDVRRQVIRPPADRVPDNEVNALLGAASGVLLAPFERPGACFVITEVGTDEPGPPLLVTLLAHHALLDGWAVRELFTELATLLSGAAPASPAPSPELVLADELASRRHPDRAGQLRRQADRLSGAPQTLELPTDLTRPVRQDVAGQRLVSTLSTTAVAALHRISEGAGCTRTAALLAAYALVLGRRVGATDLVVGVPAAGRDRHELQRVLALCSRIVPVRCRMDDAAPALSYVAGIAAALALALDGAGIPFEDLVTAIAPEHDPRRTPIVQFVLGAHDDLIPETIRYGDVELRISEGHCGGAPFDATLFVQRGGAAPRLALEYGRSVLTPAEAADLLDSLDTALTELAGGLTTPLAWVRTISRAQLRRLAAVSGGLAPPELPGAADVWALVRAAATDHPDAQAVSDGAVRLTFAELVSLARHQAASLAAHGVRDGDPVLIALPRGAAEIVAILAVLALGAHYVAVDPDTPGPRLRKLFAIVAPAAAVVGADAASSQFAHRAVAAAPRPFPHIGVPELGAARPSRRTAAGSPVFRPVAPNGDRVAYVAFTSGSTGIPKAVRVPHRAVARLVRPGPQACVQAGPGERMLRLAPLAFDASTLELFAPLAAGGCVEVYPPGPADPAELAGFIGDHGVTVLWLTAGLFRLVADFAPHGFATVRHLLTGGDVVPPAQVRDLLDRYPGLRISNGYGPTENTTFSTVAHFDDPAHVRDPLPIGRAIAGSGALILDEAGRMVPPGGIGELRVTGLGLALDYAGAPDLTAASFGAVPGSGERAYRTGDMVRLDGDDQLRYLGRRDHQVKIRGFRVELDEVRQVLLSQPGVKDAVVLVIGDDASARRLLAALAPERGSRLDLEAVAARVSGVLPGYAVPVLWAVVNEMPITGNGKVDTSRLATMAGSLGEAAAAGQQRALDEVQPDVPDPGKPAAADAVASAAWTAVLGRAPASPDSDFFRSGGDSLALARLIALLGADHGVRLDPREVYACPTPRKLAELIGPVLASRR